MDDLVKIILDKFEQTDRTGEIERQLDKVVEKETQFVKEFSKEKWVEYFDLSGEILTYHGMRLEQAIEIAVQVCKKIYRNQNEKDSQLFGYLFFE